MATKTYEIRVDGDVRMTFSADFAQASSPLLLEGAGTPFQVADAKHRPYEAARLLIDWSNQQGGSNVADDEDYEVEVVEEEEVVIKLVTAAGTNASAIGDRYAMGNYEGTVNWRNSVDRCDSDGEGRVFLHCSNRADADAIAELLKDDEEVTDFEYDC